MSIYQKKFLKKNTVKVIQHKKPLKYVVVLTTKTTVLNNCTIFFRTQIIMDIIQNII